uniref:Uncharacterized protein n=1 Tax=Echeneis naucrates TaxID=173247 RepID=A0A665UDX4_ECHNA
MTQSMNTSFMLDSLNVFLCLSAHTKDSYTRHVTLTSLCAVCLITRSRDPYNAALWCSRLYCLIHHILFSVNVAGVLFLLAYSAVTVLLGSYGATAVITVIQASQLARLILATQLHVRAVLSLMRPVKLSNDVTYQNLAKDNLFIRWISFQVLQAGTNYFNGHTGQLSTLSVLLTWAGSYGFVWISLQVCFQESHQHNLSACLSSVLLIQVLCYRSSTGAKEKKE